MSGIAVCGWGAVSPAGWGTAALRETVTCGRPAPVTELTRPGLSRPLRVRAVPPPATRPPFLAHARLRRTSPIAQYVVSAALEALGSEPANAQNGKSHLGIIFCAMAGCVNYSKRFYDETLRDPATASPLVFPETVFNAPASHLAALLGATACNYTLVGDPGTFLQGIALAADWLLAERVDSCLVIAAEELDWLVAEAFHYFTSEGTMSAGAGALHLRTPFRLNKADSRQRREPGLSLAQPRQALCCVTACKAFTGWTRPKPQPGVIGRVRGFRSKRFVGRPSWPPPPGNA